MIKEQVKDYFATLAPDWDRWQKKNSYYYRSIFDFLRKAIPPGQSVLHVGCGTGEFLATLQPELGVGLNLCDELTQMARQRNPGQHFFTIENDRLSIPADFKFDYVVLISMLDYVYDIGELFDQLKNHLTPDSLIIIMTSNPMWAPILKLASDVGMRVPNSTRNFISNKDIENIIEIAGYKVIKEGLLLPFPRFFPLISFIANTMIPEIPVLRYTSSLQYITCRPIQNRGQLTCSVVVPCHNEEGNIAECIARVPKLGNTTEIVVVDDGSTDATRAKVLEVKKTNPRVRLIATDKNQGKMNAVRAGFENSKNDVLIILDADMAVAPEDLGNILKPLENGTAEFVNGTRLVYPMEGKAMRFANFLGNKGFCFLVSWVLRQRVSDTLCGTKAFFRRYLKFIPHKEKERWGDFELLFAASRLHLKIKEVAVHYHERRAGASKMRVVHDGVLFLRSCWYGWRMSRLKGSETDLIPQAQSVVGWREIN